MYLYVLFSIGELTTLEECPIGLFLSSNGNLCLKTEYGNNEGLIDAYIVESGERFWGPPPQTIESQRKALVMPVIIDAEELREISKASKGVINNGKV